MRRTILAALIFALAVLSSDAAEVIERIVATVNAHPILQSDWDDEVAFESFMEARDPAYITDQQRKAALDHLIDQELLRQHMLAPDFPHASNQDVDRRIAEIRKEYSGAASDDGWRAALARYGIAEGELHRRIALELDVMRLVDSRFRPSVQIDSKTIESYYNQQLLPQLRQAGANDVPLAQVSPKIRELLTQEKMNQMLTTWLRDLRSSSDIRTVLSSSTGGGQAE